MLQITLISLIAVTIPLLLGGLFSLFLKDKKESLVDSFVFISIGTLLFLLLIEIFPEFLEISSSFDKDFGLIYGILLIFIFILLIVVIHKAIDRILYKHDEHCHHEHSHDHGHIDVYLEKKKESLKKAGIALIIALIFHNFPEGLSLGILTRNDFIEGINLTFSLFIHNLIMGLTMAIPLIMSEMKKKNVFILLLLSSIPSLLGAIIGYYLPNENNIMTFIMFGFSIAILIFVIYEEVISILKKKFKIQYILFVLLGLILSFLIHLLH